MYVKAKNVFIKLIKDVLSFYPELSKVQFIALNGSFARGSNIFASDLDFNLFYENKYRDILFPIELRIQYVLSKLLEFKGCDRIHSIMVYMPVIYSYFAFYDGFGVLNDPFYFDVHSIATKDYFEGLQKVSNDTQKNVYAIFDDGVIIYHSSSQIKLFGHVDLFHPNI